MNSKNILLLLFYCFLTHIGYTQIDTNSLLRIPSASTNDIASIAGVNEGSMVYDTDKKRIYKYTDTGWKEILTTGNIYVGFFQITNSGTTTITGIPFQPSSITFTAHANIEDFNLNIDNGTVNNDRGIRNSFGTMNGLARDNGGTITQQVIYVGSHGNSVNDISRYASNSNAIGVRYGDQNGSLLGNISASLTSFNSDGFSLNVTYTNGNITNTAVNPDVLPNDINNEGLIVLYTAYR